MFLLVQKIKSPIVFLTIWILVFSFFCIGVFHPRSKHMEPMEISMIFIQNQETCCVATISKHIESLVSTFLAVPQGIRDTLTLLALGLALVFAYSWISFRDRYPSPDPDVGRLRLYVQQNPDIAIFNHLKLAFARGILNPKLY